MANQQQLDFSPPPPRIPRQSIGAWLLTKALIAALTWPFILGLSGLVGYRPSAVDSRRFTGERQRWPFLTGVSVFLWLSGLMAVFASLMLTPIALVVVVPLMVLTAARVASSPYGLPVADLVAGARDLWAVSPRWRKAAQVSLGLIGLAAVLGVLLYTGRALYWSLPGQLELVGVGAVALSVLVGMVFAREVGARHREDSRGIAVSQHQLAAAIGGVFGMQPEKVLELGLIQPLGDDAFALSPIPPSSAMRTRDEMEARVAHVLPEMTIVDFQPGRIVVGPAPDEVKDSRKVMSQSGGLIVGVADEPDTELRPKAARWTLAAGTSPAQAAQAQALAQADGLSLVEWAPYEGFAIAARLTPLAQQVRAAVAAGFGVVDRPWEVEAEVVAGESPDVPVAEIRILRSPAGMADRRGRALADALLRIPGGNPDWAIDDDLATGRTTLTYRAPRHLAELVPLTGLTPTALASSSWYTLPIGRDDAGQPVQVRLKLGPHAMYVGSTGSGKSIGIVAHVTAALMRGHRVAVIDISKGAPDFDSIMPWLTATARDTPEEAASVLNAVYQEGVRRKAVARRFGVGFWEDIPADVRAAEDIVPFTLVIDEFPSFMEMEVEPKGLARDHPMIVEAQRINAAKAVSLGLVGKILRELRAWGVHLVIGSQTANSDTIPVKLRNQMVSRVQLAIPGDIPPRTDLGMLFDADRVLRAETEFRTLDDGQSRGLAVISATGGATQGFRTAFAPQPELPVILADVPLAPALHIPDFDLGTGRGKGVPKGFGVEIVEETVEEEFDISDFTFDPSDFE